MSGLSDDQDPIDVIAEEFLARRRRGEHPAIEQYLKKYPGLAGEIRAIFPALLLVDDLRPTADGETGTIDRKRGPTTAAAPEQLGDFRILREIGRGGMGVVFEVHDCEREAPRRSRGYSRSSMRLPSTDSRTNSALSPSLRIRTSSGSTNSSPTVSSGSSPWS